MSGAGRTASLCGVAQEVRRCLPCGDSDWGAAVRAPARTVARRGDLWAIKMTKSKNYDYLSREIVVISSTSFACRESSVKSSGRRGRRVPAAATPEDGALSPQGMGSATGPWSTLRKDEGDPTATRSFVLRVGFESHRR